MILGAYSIFDVKTGMYSSPFFVVHKQAAFRIAARMVNDVESMVAQFPEDFQLWKVGEWDDCAGLLLSGQENLGSLMSIVSVVRGAVVLDPAQS